MGLTLLLTLLSPFRDSQEKKTTHQHLSQKSDYLGGPLTHPVEGLATPMPAPAFLS